MKQVGNHMVVRRLIVSNQIHLGRTHEWLRTAGRCTCEDSAYLTSALDDEGDREEDYELEL